MVKTFSMKKASPTMSTTEVAEKLQVTRAAVANWCRSGFFPSAFVEQTRHGPVWHIPATDLKTFQQPTQGRPRTKNQEKPAAKRRTKRRGRSRVRES